MTRVQFRDYLNPEVVDYEEFMADVPRKDEIVTINDKERWVTRVSWYPQEARVVVHTSPGGFQ